MVVSKELDYHVTLFLVITVGKKETGRLSLTPAP
jgi:hypothetical protein